MTGDVSGDVFLGYRHVSCVSLFFSGVAGMLRLIPSPQDNVRQAAGLFTRQMLGGELPEQVSDAAARTGKQLL